MERKIVDANGDFIQLNDEVKCGAETGIITKIYSSDDMEGAAPLLVVTFGHDGVEDDTDEFTTCGTATWWDDYSAPYRCDDLELAVTS